MYSKYLLSLPLLIIIYGFPFSSKLLTSVDLNLVQSISLPSTGLTVFLVTVRLLFVSSDSDIKPSASVPVKDGESTLTVNSVAPSNGETSLSNVTECSLFISTPCHTPSLTNCFFPTSS